MAELVQFSVEADPVGCGIVTIDGADVSEQVSGLDVLVRAGQPTVLTLHHVAASGRIEGQGIVRVVEKQAAGPDAIVAWLDRIDPTALEQAVLDRAGFGDSTFEVAIEILREMARAER